MRKRIMLSALAEFQERGMKFTMDDLARRLGVSKRCLYEHFKSKEQMISAIIAACIEENLKRREAVTKRQDLSFKEKLREMLVVKKTEFALSDGCMAHDIKRCMPSIWEEIEQSIDREWDFIEAFLQEGIETGQLRPLHLPVVRKMLKGFFNELADDRFWYKNGISFFEAAEQMADVMLYGMIGRGKGRSKA